MKMPKQTVKKLLERAHSLPGGDERAKLVEVANYSLLPGETIASRIARDHRAPDHAMRSMSIMVQAGAAEEREKRPGYFGTFVFEDGSTFP